MGKRNDEAIAFDENMETGDFGKDSLKVSLKVDDITRVRVESSTFEGERVIDFSSILDFGKAENPEEMRKAFIFALQGVLITPMCKEHYEQREINTAKRLLGIAD